MYNITIKTNRAKVASEVTTLKQVALLLMCNFKSKSRVRAILDDVRHTGSCEWKAGSYYVKIEEILYIKGDNQMTLAEIEELAELEDGE